MILKKYKASAYRSILMDKKSWDSISVFCFLLLFFLYLIPTFIKVDFDDAFQVSDISFGLPGILSGDEPHYFVATTSLINDHDYFVENNYDNALLGGCDLGYRLINNTHQSVGRHIMLYNPDKKILTALNAESNYNIETYDNDLEKLFSTYNVTTFLQVPSRPLGLPVFSTFFLWPFKEMCIIEHAAIYITVLVSLIGILFFYCISTYYIELFNGKKSKKLAIFFTVIFALATPLWHYSKTYFTEPYLATCLLGAYYYFFVKKKSVISGFFLGVGFSMKYPFGIFIWLFALLGCLEKQWKRVVYFCLGALLPVIATFYYNWTLTGSIFLARSVYLTYFDYYLTGSIAALVDPIFGILPFAPFLVFAFLGGYVLYRKDKKFFFQFMLLIIPYFVFWGGLSLTPVGGGGAYASRYQLPLIGLLSILCLVWYIHNKSIILQRIFFFLVFVSFLINIQAAFIYILFWNNPPWILVTTLMTEWKRVIALLW